jgi:hypothetical protein
VAHDRRTTNSSKTLWDDDNGVENVLGHPAFVSTNVPASSIVALDCSKVVFAIWGDSLPVSLVVDPYTNKRTEAIEVVSTIRGDVALANPNAACISSGSTTQ